MGVYLQTSGDPRNVLKKKKKLLLKMKQIFFNWFEYEKTRVSMKLLKELRFCNKEKVF